ncbi:MAG: PAS domain-containing protein [Spirochaetaceae bacterium]|jgi:predicted transcriptional regulator YheO|nr:PAS domain-containing protein [Spirochaetaceae bacterium]
MNAKQQLSTSDQLIIESYKDLMEALAAYLGDAFEFVLHSLTDLDHSVIKIVNGFHSGRKEGAPITDFALNMLEKIRCDADGGNYANYLSTSKYGKPVKSTTIVIFGEARQIIGLLCINMYLDSPITTLLQHLSLNTPSEYIAENFINDSDELIKRALDKVKTEVLADDSISASQKNKEIVTRLYYQGIFKLKNAVPLTSQELGLSRNTVYMHIRTLEENSPKI